MAVAILSAPGTIYGPCVDTCQHVDCAGTRAMAATTCHICGEPIGYETRFYQVPDKSLVHARCIEAQEREQQQQKGSQLAHGAASD